MGQRWGVWWRSGERERRWQGLGVGDAYEWREDREARWSSWGEGDVDIGRRWRAWWCSGERKWREQGPGGSWRRLGEQERPE